MNSPRQEMAVPTGVLGRDLGVLTDSVFPVGGVPLTPLGVKLPLLLALKLLTCLKTLRHTLALSLRSCCIVLAVMIALSTFIEEMY